MSKEMTEYLYASIADIQGTIRAIDIKLIGLLAILILPLSIVGKVSLYVKQAIITNNVFILWLSVILAASFFLTWLISITISIIGLSSTENPIDFLTDSKCPTGTFFNGGLFKFYLLDLFQVSPKRKSFTKLDDQFQKLPITTEQVNTELLFEQHKLIFIRDIKIYRQKMSFLFLSIFLISGILLWFVTYCLKDFLCH
jgi:hypothetical protein